jgi:hypothetical protein
VFDVALEGVERVSDLDVVAQVGPNTAHDVTLPVSVSDGKLDIDFMADVENPNVSAIKVAAAGESGTQPPPDDEPPTDLDPITLVATAGALDGSAGPQQWAADVTISALDANGSAAVISHGADGFGVQGGRFDTQVDHIPSNNTSEQFALKFGGAVSDVVLRLGRMNPDEGETGTWTAFDAAGSEVASGMLDPANGAKIATWTYDIPIDAGGQSFTELLLTATGYDGGVSGAPGGDSSDFAIKELTYTPDPSDGESLALENDDSMADSLLIA